MRSLDHGIALELAQNEVLVRAKTNVVPLAVIVRDGMGKGDEELR